MEPHILKPNKATTNTEKQLSRGSNCCHFAKWECWRLDEWLLQSRVREGNTPTVKGIRDLTPENF